MRLHELFEKKDPYYAADDSDIIHALNPDSDSYRDKEEKESKKRFSQKATNIVKQDVDNGEEPWSTEPDKDDTQSPGYRGQQEAKANAGMPYKKYQKYNPTYFKQNIPTNYYNRNLD